MSENHWQVWENRKSVAEQVAIQLGLDPREADHWYNVSTSEFKKVEVSQNWVTLLS